MRTLKELIPLLIKEIKEGENLGLCGANYDLFWYKESLDEDFDLLQELIKKAKPHWWQPRYYCYQGVFYCRFINKIYSPFYWQRGRIKPRVKWLKKQLKKCV